ncbi:MFS transporter [Rhodococcus sp. BP-253]|uniref:MFS transporter n=1 Tax=Rhodococcus sp. BP-253 TaxID=2739480 RepID=UPI001C9B91EA|nr:MFS transporter [Rhodococcus sp. BP-253]
MIQRVGTSAVVTETSEHSESTRLLRGRILVFAAIIVSALTLRAAVTSISPLFGRIGDDLHFGSGVIGLVGMLPPAMFAVFGLLTPVIAKRTGLERAALIAMTMTTVGMAVRAFAPGTVSLLVLSALALAGMGIGNVVIPPLVKRYFSDRLAVVSTMYICAMQISTLAPPLLTVPVANAHGWRISIGVWAVVGLAAAVPWLGVVLARRGRDVADVSGEEGSAAVHEESTGRIWRSSLAWGMVGMFAMTSFITYAMLTWLPTLLTDAGIGEAAAGASVAAFGAMGLVTSLGAPSLCARLRNPYGLVVVAAVFYLVGFAGLHWSPASGTVVWVCLLGLGTLTFPMSLTLMNLRTRTPAGSSGLSGFTQGLGYVVSSMGPLSFGLLHSLSGGWGVPVLVLTVCVAVLLVAGYFCCRPRMLEDTW